MVKDSQLAEYNQRIKSMEAEKAAVPKKMYGERNDLITDLRDDALAKAEDNARAHEVNVEEYEEQATDLYYETKGILDNARNKGGDQAAKRTEEAAKREVESSARQAARSRRPAHRKGATRRTQDKWRREAKQRKKNKRKMTPAEFKLWSENQKKKERGEDAALAADVKARGEAHEQASSEYAEAKKAVKEARSPTDRKAAKVALAAAKQALQANPPLLKDEAELLNQVEERAAERGDDPKKATSSGPGSAGQPNDEGVEDAVEKEEPVPGQAGQPPVPPPEPDPESEESESEGPAAPTTVAPNGTAAPADEEPCKDCGCTPPCPSSQVCVCTHTSVGAAANLPAASDPTSVQPSKADEPDPVSPTKGGLPPSGGGGGGAPPGTEFNNTPVVAPPHSGAGETVAPGTKLPPVVPPEVDAPLPVKPGTIKGGSGRVYSYRELIGPCEKIAFGKRAADLAKMHSQMTRQLADLQSMIGYKSRGSGGLEKGMWKSVSENAVGKVQVAAPGNNALAQGSPRFIASEFEGARKALRSPGSGAAAKAGAAKELFDCAKNANSMLDAFANKLQKWAGYIEAAAIVVAAAMRVEDPDDAGPLAGLFAAMSPFSALAGALAGADGLKERVQRMADAFKKGMNEGLSPEALEARLTGRDEDLQEAEAHVQSWRDKGAVLDGIFDALAVGAIAFAGLKKALKWAAKRKADNLAARKAAREVNIAKKRAEIRAKRDGKARAPEGSAAKVDAPRARGGKGAGRVRRPRKANGPSAPREPGSGSHEYAPPPTRKRPPGSGTDVPKPPRTPAATKSAGAGGASRGGRAGGGAGRRGGQAGRGGPRQAPPSSRTPRSPGSGQSPRGGGSPRLDAPRGRAPEGSPASLDTAGTGRAVDVPSGGSSSIGNRAGGMGRTQSPGRIGSGPAPRGGRPAPGSHGFQPPNSQPAGSPRGGPQGGRSADQGPAAPTSQGQRLREFRDDHQAAVDELVGRLEGQYKFPQVYSEVTMKLPSARGRGGGMVTDVIGLDSKGRVQVFEVKTGRARLSKGQAKNLPILARRGLQLRGARGADVYHALETEILKNTRRGDAQLLGDNVVHPPMVAVARFDVQRLASGKRIATLSGVRRVR